MVTTMETHCKYPALHPVFDNCPVQIMLETANAESVPAWAAAIGDIGSVLLVADPQTYEALGNRVKRLLPDRLDVVEHIFSKPPHATAPVVEEIARRAKQLQADAILAVGSGTINDISKYASYLLHLPYCVAATAPSMNGYISVNASISIEGHKQTFPAHLPKAVLVDLDVMATAPMRLIRAGFGDSVCRATAQADWLLSHHLLGTEYKEAPFGLLEPFEDTLIAQAGALQKRDREAINLLMQTLLASGYGMTIAGGSYPASQGEHLIAHAMEQRFGKTLQAVYHGESIAVTTLTMARLQERILAMETLPPLQPVAMSEEAITQIFGRASLKPITEAFAVKQLPPDELKALNLGLQSEWPAIRRRIQEIHRPAEELEAALQAAGAPTMVEDIGWGQKEYQETVSCAHWLRDRFTFLDLAAMV